MVFTGACLGFVLAASARWCIAEGNLTAAGQLAVVSGSGIASRATISNYALTQGTGASWFAISILGWYLLAIQLFSIMGIRVPLPVGDLTHYWDKKPKDAAHEA